MKAAATDNRGTAMNISYPVHIDLEGFRDMYLAQSKSFFRATSAIGAVALWPMIIFIGPAPYLQGDIEMSLCMFLLTVLAVFCTLQAIHPRAVLSTRGMAVRQWFAQHGSYEATKTNAATAFYDTHLKELTCDYTVTLGAYGFSETSAAGLRDVPWFALSGKVVKGKTGKYFCVDRGKEDSLIYNYIGFNAYFRSDNIAGILYIPNEVLAANPDLEQQIRNAIGNSRRRYLNKEGMEQLKQDTNYVAWIAASDLHLPRNPHDLEPVPAGTPFADLRFFSEDLFCLLGGQDPCLAACNDHILSPDNLSLAKPTAQWRQALSNRLGGSGWLDAEGNPTGDLARAVDILMHAETVISDNWDFKERTKAVVFGKDGACGVVHDEAFLSPRDGWQLVLFPDDHAQWPQAFDKVFSLLANAFRPAAYDFHAVFTCDREYRRFSKILKGQDNAYLQAMAQRQNFDPAPLEAFIMDSKNRDSKRIPLFIKDLTGCRPDTSKGWRDFMAAIGEMRTCRVAVRPLIGAAMRFYGVWTPTEEERATRHGEWIKTNDVTMSQRTGWCGIDFFSSGSVYEMATMPFAPLPDWISSLDPSEVRKGATAYESSARTE